MKSALKNNDICMLSFTKKGSSVIEKNAFSILHRLLFDLITTVLTIWVIRRQKDLSYKVKMH
jgi:hypothetical protein